MCARCAGVSGPICVLCVCCLRVLGYVLWGGLGLLGCLGQCVLCVYACCLRVLGYVLGYALRRERGAGLCRCTPSVCRDVSRLRVLGYVLVVRGGDVSERLRLECENDILDGLQEGSFGEHYIRGPVRHLVKQVKSSHEVPQQRRVH